MQGQSFLISNNADTFMQKARSLRLSARKLANSFSAGSFRSLMKGHGIELNGVREYLYGDDVRAIDWNVTARMGKPFVKVFEEEHEMQVFFVIDKSLSMFSGTAKKSRYDVAKELCALLTLASELHASSVGAVFFDGEIQTSFEPQQGSERTMLMLSKLSEENCVQKNGSALSLALNGAANLLKKTSFVFVLSDFRTTNYIKGLARLSQKHDVLAIRITDESDSALPELGSLPFIDVETKEIKVFPTNTSRFRNAWRDENRSRLEQWKNQCLRHGVLPLTVSTEEDAAKVLIDFFSQKGKA